VCATILLYSHHGIEFPYAIFQSFYSIYFILSLIKKILKIVKAILLIYLGKKRDRDYFNAERKCVKIAFLIEYQAK